MVREVIRWGCTAFSCRFYKSRLISGWPNHALQTKAVTYANSKYAISNHLGLIKSCILKAFKQGQNIHPSYEDIKNTTLLKKYFALQSFCCLGIGSAISSNMYKGLYEYLI